MVLDSTPEVKLVSERLKAVFTGLSDRLDDLCDFLNLPTYELSL